MSSFQKGIAILGAIFRANGANGISNPRKESQIQA
jgi:hypothetical protein